MDEKRQLINLNRLTFQAESRPAEPIEGRAWDAFLSDALTADFVGRRARPTVPHQGRDAFIAFAWEAADDPRNIVGDPTVWIDGDLAVITADIRLGDDDSVRFRNVKVFVRTDRWRCSYWQVTPFESAAS